jgi:hypothetical protein
MFLSDHHDTHERAPTTTLRPFCSDAPRVGARAPVRCLGIGARPFMDRRRGLTLQHPRHNISMSTPLRVWQPADRPFPQAHPLGGSHKCMEATWRASFNIGIPPIAMCTHDFGDPVSAALRDLGQWNDCANLLGTYRTLSDREGPASIFLEVSVYIRSRIPW